MTRTGALAALLLLPIASLGGAPQRAGVDSKVQTPQAAQAAPASHGANTGAPQAAIAAGKEPARQASKGRPRQADKFVVVVGYATPLLIRGPDRPPVTAKLRSPAGTAKRSCSSPPHSS
ncbi:MAG: hypothetical protein KGO22_11530 [Gammaproteobacteria bacterium]|nr:hypothetical protein [Gammaproteobacteria bacterium]